MNRTLKTNTTLFNATANLIRPLMLGTLGLLSAFWGVLAVNTQAQSPVFTNNGPNAAVATKSGSEGGGEIAIAPSNPSIVYLSTNKRGAFKSTDSGATWTEINNGIPVDTFGNRIPPTASLVVDPTNANIAYRGFKLSNIEPIYKTTDGGATWAPSRLGLPASFVFTMAIHPSAPNTIYAGLTGVTSGVWRSTDGGATWNLRSNGMITPQNTFPTITDMAIAPGNSNVIYAATRSGFYKTTDGGANWTQKLASQFSDISSAKIVVHPTNPDIFYMTFFNSGGFMGLGKSTTGAETNLTVITIPNTASFPFPRGLALDQANPNTVYVGIGNDSSTSPALKNGVFKSTDGGATWANLRNGLPNELFFPDLISVNPTNPATMFVGTTLGSYRSTDGGANWQAIHGIRDADVQKIAYFSADDSIAYTATNAGYFKTTNRGVSWTRITAPPDWVQRGIGRLPTTQALAVSPNDSNIIFAGLNDNAFWRSLNGGSTWTRGGAGIQSDFVVTGIWTDPNNAEVVYCTAGIITGQVVLYKSTDTGGTFQALAPPVSVGSYMRLAVSQVTANTIFLVVKSQSSSSDYLVYKSTNGGFTWTEIFRRNSYTSDVVLSPSDPNLVFVVSITGGCSFSAPLIYRSTNGGTSFTSMASTGLAGGTTTVEPAVGYDPANGALYLESAYYAPGPNCGIRTPAIMRSLDGGASWSVYAQTSAGGLPAATFIRGTASVFAPTSRTFYLGTTSASVLVGTIVNDNFGLSVSGRALNSSNQGVPDITVTLSGPVSRTVITNQSGDYAFNGLQPGGNYTVIAANPTFTFTPPRADFTNLTTSLTQNFTAQPVAPAAIPPFMDNFPPRPNPDPTLWSLGILTQPPGSFDPAVTVSQQTGQLVITPVANQTGLHYGGYVAVNRVWVLPRI